MAFHKHPRLPGHDYTQGTYFITLCTAQRRELFGRISGTGPAATMELNAAGRIVETCWNAIPDHFPNARIDRMQIMPDHLHAIVVLSAHASTRWVDATPALGSSRDRPRGPERGSLGAIVAAFKSETTKRINRLQGITGHRIWQPGYHERIVRRDGGEYERIDRYIAENPENWR